MATASAIEHFFFEIRIEMSAKFQISEKIPLIFNILNFLQKLCSIKVLLIDGKIEIEQLFSKKEGYCLCYF